MFIDSLLCAGVHLGIGPCEHEGRDGQQTSRSRERSLEQTPPSAPRSSQRDPVLLTSWPRTPGLQKRDTVNICGDIFRTPYQTDSTQSNPNTPLDLERERWEIYGGHSFITYSRGTHPAWSEVCVCVCALIGVCTVDPPAVRPVSGGAPCPIPGPLAFALCKSPFFSAAGLRCPWAPTAHFPPAPFGGPGVASGAEWSQVLAIQ